MLGTNLIRSLPGNRLLPHRDHFFGPLEDSFNKFFDDFFNEGGLNSVKSRINYPKLDVFTENDKWVIEVAVPGSESKDIDIEICPYDADKRILKIKGQMAENKNLEKSNYVCKELRRSYFERTVLLPEEIQGDPEALLKNGILRLSWNYSVPPKERKSIKIKTE